MKRQDSSLLSSSSRRQSSPENLHSHTIGCMSGLFHLLSKYQKRRKFLTFGKKSEKGGSVVSSPIKKGAKSSAIAGGCLDHDGENKELTTDQFRRLSCDVPRSPTLPAEIRRSNSVDSPGNYYRRPPALVARLMGLGESYAAPESTAEKRLKLLAALERCDRDLKALKKIIESVQSRNTPPRDGDEGGGECEKELAAEAKLTNGEQPIPVSVLDELTRSPLCSYTRRLHATSVGAPGGIVKQQQQKKRPGEEDIISLNLLERIATGSFQSRSCEEGGAGSPALLSRKAMVESVNEACRDVAWGEKRELGRIGVALQDLICRDLVEEFVKDMSRCRPNNSLPFEACKRKLRF